MTTLTIRAAKPLDMDALLVCDAYAQAHEGRRAALRRWVDAETVLVAERDGNVVGFIVLEHGFFGHGFAPLVCVRADARRAGVATELLAAAESKCRTPKLFTSTNASNRAAQALFARVGFQRSGTIENLDAEDPEWVYCKALAQPAKRV